VEVTLHPADMPAAEEPEPFPPAPPDALSKDDAVDAARDAVPGAEEWRVADVRAGPLGQLDFLWETYEWADDLSADRWVWSVFLTRGDQGARVVIDFVDGSVYGVIGSIS
jgi:hypothetical protein